VIRFATPEAFLLAPVLALVLRRRLVHGRLVTALRVLLLAAVLALLAGPEVEGGAPGRDLVLLVDRSASMPAEALDAWQEHAALAKRHAQPGDRVGVVFFGRDALVDTAPVADYAARPPAASVDPGASDLARGIESALALVPPGREGSILLVSDGEATGRDPLAAARHAARRGVRIDAVPIRRGGAFDLAVEELGVPAEVAAGEPFAFSAWVRADRAVEAPFRLLRDGAVLATGRASLTRGLNRLPFRDRLAEPGLHHYDLEVSVADDRVQENNRARGALQVTGPFRVLCVTPQGRDDRLTRSLAAAGIETRVAAPESAPLDLERLLGVRAVVLEGVPLADLPTGAADALATWVRELGGGLLMTGGEASFGPGGYHRSPVEEVLPVSMEIREEQRKFALAMAIALDRSGSMAVGVPGGGTKMDLANLGAVAAIELLTPSDSVSVLAVDSAAHVVVPLTEASERAGIVARVRTIEAGGGGIFVYAALLAAAHMLKEAPQGAKHIVLFADANDAEEPGAYEQFVPALRRAGVTVSVIGLGKDTDSDAAFLRDVARLGGGRCVFGEDPADLPRMFAQETIQVARSSVVKEPTAVRVLPDLTALGPLQSTRFPAVGGYSIAYLKPGARRALVTEDETAAPLLSFWHAGLGRAAAFLGEADGDLSGDLAAWDGYAELFGTLVRWIAGTEAVGALHGEVSRQGHEAVISVEVEPGDEALLGGLEGRLVAPDGSGLPTLLARVADTRVEARVPLEREGAYLAAVRTGDGRVLRLPAIALPYSPEFEPRVRPDEGLEMLREIARTTGGTVDPTAEALFAGSRRARGLRPVEAWFAWAALALFLLEVAVRRLHLGAALPAALRPLGRVARTLRGVARRAPERADPEAPAAADDDAPAPKPAPPAGPAPAPGAAPAPPPSDLASVLDRARRRRRP
jgi:Mg-chelatase subunit ChlD